VYEKRRLRKMQARPSLEQAPLKKSQMVLIGVVGWGGMMWLFMAVVPFLYHWGRNTANQADLMRVILALPIMLICGLLWGLFMAFFMERKSRAAIAKQNHDGSTTF
jgi:hypothetical protein